jgi:hypothetical protein
MLAMKRYALQSVLVAPVEEVEQLPSSQSGRDQNALLQTHGPTRCGSYLRSPDHRALSLC